jgi:phospholipid-binding lipoprotein MlaA
MHRIARLCLLVLTCLALFGCAAAPAKRDPRDPFERLNRTTFKFNDSFDRHVYRPVARGYQKVVPHVVRTGISNFLDNLSYTVTIANDLLQLKFKAFGMDTGRLVMNTTLGVGGLLDPASAAGLQKNDQDLGLTFARWGAKSPGPYLVVPFLGPSDVRDGIGRIGDIWLDPRHYIKNNAATWSLWGVDVIDIRYRLLSTDQYLDSAYDRYAFLRNAYLQRRQFLVSQGENPDQQDQEQYKEEQQILDESGPDQPKKSSDPLQP